MALTRRRFLWFGAAGVIGGCAAEGTQAPAPRGATTAAVGAASMSQVVWRSGIGDVKVITMRPREVAGVLPVCLALHGSGADATQFVDLGLPALLTATVRAGAPPFAIVAVDGGTTNWAGDAAVDPQRMLLEELPAWLEQSGLAASPFAALGVSTGVAGAFAYARTPGLALVAAVSPAVFTFWAEAQDHGGYADRAAWERVDPLTTPTAAASVAVWCGADDPFAPAARALAERTRAGVAEFAPGGHDPQYWRQVFPEVLRYIGRSLGGS